jgi:hypothetical protein
VDPYEVTKALMRAKLAENATTEWDDVIGSELMNGGDCVNPQPRMSKKKRIYIL